MSEARDCPCTACKQIRLVRDRMAEHKRDLERAFIAGVFRDYSDYAGFDTWYQKYYLKGK